MAYKDKKIQREYQRKWMAKRRFDFFSNNQCLKCGSIEHLELHHRDPSKKETHSIWSWSEERRKVEIAKCDVLCHDCHVEEHRPVLVHGTMPMYDRGKCRCLLCRAINAKKKREAKWLKKEVNMK